MRMLWWMPALAVGLLLGADAKDDVKKEKEKLQGTWKCVKFEEKGESREDADHRIVFDGDNFSVKRGDEAIIKGTFKLDPSKQPKEIDIEVKGGTRAEGDVGKTAQGIYARDGDELKLCVHHPGGTDRPKEFSAPAGSQRVCITLKREKS